MSTGTRTEPVGKANERHDLYRWVQDGQEWACCAYDHGSMCRRCQPVDEIGAALLDNVEDGLLRMWDSDREGWQFQVAEDGEERAKLMIHAVKSRN